MITARIIGGLGNQMFQYAAGRSLSLRNNDSLKLDTRGFSQYKLHSYGLNHFNTKENFSQSEELALNQYSNIYSKVNNFLKTNKSIKVFKERGLAFDPRFNSIKGDIYLDGYWQTELYFKAYESVIRDDFKIITPPTQKNLEVLREIRSSTSISLHIRRGDYVNNPQTNSIHGVCSMDYYQTALQLLKAKIGNINLHIFVFSDDYEWVERNLIIDGKVTYIKHNSSKTNYEDLRLMSTCQHHIIANSSFSWWGAWLNPSAEKIVIAPKKWFQSAELDSRDITPESWIRL